MVSADLMLSVLQTASVIIASGVAVYGVNAWRRESIGKRRADVAVAALEAFYEARDVLKYVRSAAGYSSEGESREPAPMETEDETRAKNAHFTPIERLDKNREFFAKLQASRYKFMAVFGADKAKPFDEILSIRQRIILSASMLAQTYGSDSERLGPKRRSWEEDIGWGVEDVDPMVARIDEAVTAVESICRPVLVEQ